MAVSRGAASAKPTTALCSALLSAAVLNSSDWHGSLSHMCMFVAEVLLLLLAAACVQVNSIIVQLLLVTSKNALITDPSLAATTV
jgi:hypothetical protein